MSSYTSGFTQARGPELRRDKRLLQPVFTVTVDQQVCETVNWSLGGLLIRRYDGVLWPGRLVLLRLKVKHSPAPSGRFRAAENELAIEAEVVRNDRKNHLLAVKFGKLTPTTLKFLERSFADYNRRARGRD